MRVGVAEGASVCSATVAPQVALFVGGSIGNMCCIRLPNCSRCPPREQVSQSLYVIMTHSNSSYMMLPLFVLVCGLWKDSIDEVF